MDSGQIAKAASIIESDDPRRACKLYLQAKRPARAGRLLLVQDELISNEKLVTDIVKALKTSDLYELAGEIYERIGDSAAAIEAYAKSGAYARAVDLGSI